MSKYEFEYDSWFRDDIPKAQYGSLQCWIENEKTRPWTTAYEIMPSLVGSEMCIRDSLHMVIYIMWWFWRGRSEFNQMIERGRYISHSRKPYDFIVISDNEFSF